MKKNKLRETILGALVADAASVGLHWLYDQKRIKKVAPESPEFRTPSPNDYQGVPGFFAHGDKRVGDFSHYGEQVMVLLDSLAGNEGLYNKGHYEDRFRKHFGYGGAYVGYIDHPTRETLDNIARSEHESIERAKAIPFDVDDNSKHMMITKALANIKAFEGEELRAKLEEAVRITHDSDEIVAYAFNVLAELENVGDFHGADDEQLPAISKLPALLASKAGLEGMSSFVESAVRITNDNEKAVEYGHAAVAMIEAAISTPDPKTAILEGRKKCSPQIMKLIDEALSYSNEDSPTVTSRFGMSCNLEFGFPSVIHNAITADSYSVAVGQNIYAGGDSCGRAILLGAILGASYGVGGEKGIPEEWVEKLTQFDGLNDLLKTLDVVMGRSSR